MRLRPGERGRALSFSRAVAWTIDAEGGDKLVHDDGGATRWGIAQRYNRDVDVETLTREGAEAIYLAKYWNGSRAGEVAAPLGFVLFEFAVNPGLGAAIKGLQTEANVTADGVFGPKTLRAVRRADLPRLCAGVLYRRSAYWQTQARRYPYKVKWLRGWLMRNYHLSLEVGRWLTEV